MSLVSVYYKSIDLISEVMINIRYALILRLYPDLVFCYTMNNVILYHIPSEIFSMLYLNLVVQ